MVARGEDDGVEMGGFAVDAFQYVQELVKAVQKIT